MATLMLALAAVVFATNVSAQYRWTDADGRTVYGDSPPRDARNIQRIDARGASGAADALAALPFETRRAAQQFPVLLYTTGNCQPCDSARELLRARGIPYSERTISTKEDVEQLEKMGLGRRLPVLTVGRQVQKEFETGGWHAVLDAAGYPRSGQLPRSWPSTPTPLVPRATEPPPPAVPLAEPAPPSETTN